MNTRRWWVRVALLALGLTVSVPRLSAGAPSSDYEAELARYQKSLTELEAGALAAPADTDQTTKHIYLLYWRASLMGDLAGLAATETVIDRALERFGPSEDLVLLKADLDFKRHRLAAARQDVALLPGETSGSPRVKTLLADLDFQEGRYADAASGYAEVTRTSGSWDGYVRMAYLKSKLGGEREAESLYARAEDEITAKEMRAYAWVELQRGLLDLTHGRYERAAGRYRRAEQAYSGYWLIDEHRAELLGAQKRFGEACALYEKVITRAPRPEIEQSYGDLCQFMGQGDRAEAHHARALAGYLASAGRGETQYFHHLTGFYADVRRDGAEAVKWARLDLALRANFMTQDAMAWACYQAGRFPEALECMKQALASGVQDAHIFCHAGMIYLVNGQDAAGKEFLRRAAEINPRYTDFHVHR